MTAVVINNVNKTFKKEASEIVALNNTSLSIEAGSFVCLMGPSGSGKSTLLNMIAGIDNPTSGQILVDGEDITRLSQGDLAVWRNHTIGFVFQTFNLIPVLTAFENVELPLLLTRLSKADRREHVTTALSLVGLGDRMTHYPRQLSGGQEQRVAIARAIVTDPALILADEPTGDLDAQSAEEVLAILEKLNKEFQKTVVMVTHDIRAARHATVVRHLDKGVLLPEGVTV
jgi:putative ABC transport system ATP-binding protein